MVSVLLLPLVGFLPIHNHPRIASTIAVVRNVQLPKEGLIRRTRPRAGKPNEGAFLACSCWMAERLEPQVLAWNRRQPSSSSASSLFPIIWALLSERVQRGGPPSRG